MRTHPGIDHLSYENLKKNKLGKSYCLNVMRRMGVRGCRGGGAISANILGLFEKQCMTIITSLCRTALYVLFWYFLFNILW